MLQKKVVFLIYILFIVIILNQLMYIKSFKTCIFGLALGLSSKSINLFLKSLEETKYKSVVILFLYNKSKAIFYNCSFSLITVIINNEYPFYSSRNILFNLKLDYLKECMIPNRYYKYKWNIYRFSFINCWLNKYYYFYDFYFILDVRDTIFQRNIQEVKYKNILYLSEDARNPFKIKYDYANKKWINDIVKDSPIESYVPLNSGTIYGSQKYFKIFIHQYVDCIKSLYINTAEQGTLNYLYYSHKLTKIPIDINRNEKGLIYNMGIEILYRRFFSNITYNIKDGILYRLPYNNIPYIVHQYDRDKLFLSYLNNKYLN